MLDRMQKRNLSLNPAIRLGMRGLKAAQQTESRGYWWLKNCVWANHVSHSPESQNPPGWHQKQHGQRAEGGGSPSPAGVLCSALGFPAWEQLQRRPQRFRGQSTWTMKTGWETWGYLSSEEKAPRRPYHSLPALIRGLQERWRGSLYLGVEWEDEGIQF